ncbi:MAG: FIST signal transduction protein, partial [Parahaliea sp.]
MNTFRSNAAQASPEAAVGRIITSAVSELAEARAAALDIWRQLSPEHAACVVFFSSSDYDLGELADALGEFFGAVPVVGCTTAGEISDRGFTRNSIAAFALPASHFAVEALLLNNLAAFSAAQAHDAVRGRLRQLAAKTLAPIEGHSFVLSLLDGMSIREELVLQAINEALGGIPLLGGSAGDNLHFRDTYIYCNGHFHENSAVLILVNTLCPFQVVSSHHLEGTDGKLVVTDADPLHRLAREFNAEPAALEYCRVMGLTLAELNAS